MTDTTRRRPNPLATATLTVRTDLRLWWRQPLAVAVALIAPAVVAIVVSNAIESFTHPEVAWVVVDLDGGVASDAFTEQALGSEALRDIVTSEHVDLDEAQRLVDRDEVDAAIVLPEAMTEDVAAGRPVHLEILHPEPGNLGSDLATLVAQEFELRAWALGNEGTSDSGWPLEVQSASASGASVGVAEHYAPAIGMFFVLFALGFAAQAQVRARLDGIVDRLRSTPASSGSVTIGHAVAGVLIGGASLVTTLVVMGVVYDIRLGPPHLQVAVILAVLVAYAGVGALLAAVSRSADQALMLAIAVPFLFILASGGFSPPGEAARPRFAHLVPPTHALDAFAEIGVNDAGIATIAGPLAVLVVFGAASAAIAVWIESRR